MKSLRRSFLWVMALCVPAIAQFTSIGFAQNKLVEELRIQKVGDVTYFHLRLQAPKDLVNDEPGFRTDFVNDEGGFRPRTFFSPPIPSLSPRLVAADGKLSVVCRRLDSRRDGFDGRGRFDFKDDFGEKGPEGKKDETGPKKAAEDVNAPTPRQPVPVQGLEFVGRCEGKGVVHAKLLYPVAGRRLPVVGRLSKSAPPAVWKEVNVTLDFDRIQATEIPAAAAQRKKLTLPINELAQYAPVRDDLEGLWALAQIDQFLGLDEEVNEFGFYGFAATAMARKYHVNKPLAFTGRRFWNNISRRSPVDEGGPSDTRQLFEMTTGSAAITESLQLRRMNPPRGSFDDTKRTVSLASVKGIDIAEHPWKKMIGDKTPAPEPMAKLTPHDNYYVHFKNFSAFQDLSELLDQWGTNLLRAYQVNSRDHRLKQRYEEQLCLRSTLLGKTLGPLVINGVAITGNDPFLREGPTSRSCSTSRTSNCS